MTWKKLIKNLLKQKKKSKKSKKRKNKKHQSFIDEIQIRFDWN